MVRDCIWSWPQPIRLPLRRCRPPAATRFGFSLGIEALAHLPQALYGALIIGFLLIEPLGLGKIYNNVRDYLLVWPFGYVKK